MLFVEVAEAVVFVVVVTELLIGIIEDIRCDPDDRLLITFGYMKADARKSLEKLTETGLLRPAALTLTAATLPEFMAIKTEPGITATTSEAGSIGVVGVRNQTMLQFDHICTALTLETATFIVPITVSVIIVVIIIIIIIIIIVQCAVALATREVVHASFVNLLRRNKSRVRVEVLRVAHFKLVHSHVHPIRTQGKYQGTLRLWCARNQPHDAYREAAWEGALLS